MTAASLDGIVTIFMWIVRVVIIGSAIPLIGKMAEAKRDDDDRGFNKSLVTLLVVVAVFVASFAIEGYISSALGQIPSSEGGGNQSSGAVEQIEMNYDYSEDSIVL